MTFTYIILRRTHHWLLIRGTLLLTTISHPFHPVESEPLLLLRNLWVSPFYSTPSLLCTIRYLYFSFLLVCPLFIRACFTVICLISLVLSPLPDPPPMKQYFFQF